MIDDPKITSTSDFIRRRYEKEFERMTGQPSPIYHAGADEDLPCAECGETTITQTVPDKYRAGRRVCPSCGHVMRWDDPTDETTWAE